MNLCTLPSGAQTAFVKYSAWLLDKLLFQYNSYQGFFVCHVDIVDVKDVTSFRRFAHASGRLASSGKFANLFTDDLRFVRKLVARRQNDVILLHRSINQKVKTERESDRMIKKTKNNIRKDRKRR